MFERLALSGRNAIGLTALVALSLGLTACNRTSESRSFGDHAEPTLRERVTWEGRPAERYSVDTLAVADTLSPRFPGSARYRYHFEFQPSDSLSMELDEYSQEGAAFARFQAMADARSMHSGILIRENGIFFAHGPFLARIHATGSQELRPETLMETLSIDGEELFRKPAIFNAFPVAGRIFRSERLVSADFLGRSGLGPVFSARYHCHGDTALIFRILADTFGSPDSLVLGWDGSWDAIQGSGERRFTGLDEFRIPIIFSQIGGNSWGIRGCFDPKWNEKYAEIMKKMTVLLPKP